MAFWNGEHSPLDPRELCVGCILWLPRKLEYHHRITCNQKSCCGEELDDSGYNHPVVVVHTGGTGDAISHGDVICTVACITTFGNMLFDDYTATRSQRRNTEWSIPILDTPLQATASIHAKIPYLRLESGTLRKQSYVRTLHTYGVPISMLRQYHSTLEHAYSKRLCEESYNLLATKLGLEPQIYTSTSGISKGALGLPNLTTTGGMSNQFTSNSPLGIADRTSQHAGYLNQHYPQTTQYAPHQYEPYNRTMQHIHLPEAPYPRTEAEAYVRETQDEDIGIFNFTLTFRQTLAVYVLVGLPIWWMSKWDLGVYMLAGFVVWGIFGRNGVLHLALAPIYLGIIILLLVSGLMGAYLQLALVVMSLLFLLCLRLSNFF